MSSSAGVPPDMAAALARLWEQSQEVVEGRVATLEAAALAALDGEVRTEDLEAAAAEAHKLAGSLGTFGFPAASRAARDIEILLRSPGPLSEDRLLRLFELVVAVREDLEGRDPAEVVSAGGAPPAAPEPAGAGQRTGSAR